jgi:predicted nucleic acid-binding protein
MSGAVVVDASVALKWVLAEQYSDVAANLLIHWTSTGVTMLAPSLFAFELTNVL